MVVPWRSEGGCVGGSCPSVCSEAAECVLARAFKRRCSGIRKQFSPSGVKVRVLSKDLPLQFSTIAMIWFHRECSRSRSQAERLILTFKTNSMNRDLHKTKYNRKKASCKHGCRRSKPQTWLSYKINTFDMRRTVLL